MVSYLHPRIRHLVFSLSKFIALFSLFFFKLLKTIFFCQKRVKERENVRPEKKRNGWKRFDGEYE